MDMIGTPRGVIETPETVCSTETAELFADVLAQIRLSGALFLRGSYTAPWSLESPDSSDLRALLAPSAERLILFHAVRKGRAEVSAGGVTITLEAGELAVLPHAHQHIMASPGAINPIPIGSLLPPPPWSEIPVCCCGGGGDGTEMVCGYFSCDELLFNGFLRGLPPLFAVRPAGAAADLLDASIRYITAGSAGRPSALLARLPEVLLIEALQLYCRQGGMASGWLAAASDPLISRVLRLLHDNPAHGWSVDEIARRAATSRSVLTARFGALLGTSPMNYLAEWRIQLAANLLRETPLKLMAIAERTGYGSEAAFSRAFTRHLGMAPAQWRERATVS